MAFCIFCGFSLPCKNDTTQRTASLSLGNRKRKHDNLSLFIVYFVCVAPICLPEKNEDFLGKFGWAAGWGALNPGSRLRPKTLQAVDVPVIENR